MPWSRNPNRLTEWYLLFKNEWLPARGHDLQNWWEAVKEEPILAWETTAVRYGVYGTVLLVVVLSVAAGVDFITPPLPADARPQATTASFHVVCSRSDCGQHFLIERKFGFGRFPVDCPQCHNKTGLRGMRCSSEQCQGKYVATRAEQGRLVCVECEQSLGPAP